MARPARRRTQKMNPRFLKTNSGFRVSKNKRPVFGFGFEAALTTPNIKRFQKTAAVFPNRFVFASVCSLVRRRDCVAGVFFAEHGSTRARASSH